VATAKYLLAPVALLDTFEAGSRVVERPTVAIEDLGQIQAADPCVGGVMDALPVLPQTHESPNDFFEPFPAYPEVWGLQEGSTAMEVNTR
jgi:hypothetical protein